MTSLPGRTCLVTILALCASSCASMHEKFIRSMDGYVSQKKTIEQHGYDSQYPNGFFVADERYVVRREQREDRSIVYHYARPMITGRITCHYFLVVDPVGGLVTGWGFDRDLGDPEKTCRIAG